MKSSALIIILCFLLSQHAIISYNNSNSELKLRQCPIKNIFEHLEIKELKKENSFWKARKLYNDKKYDEAYKLIEDFDVSISFTQSYLRAKIAYQINELTVALKDINNCLKIYNDTELYEFQIKINIDMDNVKDILSSLDKLTLNSKQINQSLINEISKKISEAKQCPQINGNYFEFIKKLYEGGVYIKKMKVECSPSSYRKVVSTKEIKKDEILLKVPMNSLISLEDAKATELGQQIQRLHIEKELVAPINVYLILYILEDIEKKEKSKFTFYYNYFPDDLSNFPVFFSEEDLILLKGTNFLSELVDYEAGIKLDYNLLVKKIPEFKRFPYEEFKKYHLLISSRNFGLQINGTITALLVPYADMINHDDKNKNAMWRFNSEENYFYIKAIKDIPAGREILDSYGRRPNSFYLMNYGFTEDDNEEITYYLKIQVDNSTNFYKGIKTKGFEIKNNFDHVETQKMLSFLRYMFDNQIYSDCKDKINSRTKPFNKENEIKVLKFIQEIFTEKKNKFYSSLEEDINLRKTARLTYNQKNCFNILIAEKTIISFFIDFSKAGLTFIESEGKTNDIKFHSYTDELKELFNY